MPLRNAPLPRMAGDLTFMRSQRTTLTELETDDLAIVGMPIENNIGRKSGTRFAPTALRETSVYFGWHANPQFSHPVDIDARVPIDTSEMHSRLVDIGDLPLEGMPLEIAQWSIRSTTQQLRKTGSSAILLGGDETIVHPAVAGAIADGPAGFIQIGGQLPNALTNEANAGRRYRYALESLLAENAIQPSTTLIMAGRNLASVEFAHDFQEAGGQLWNAGTVARAEPETIERNAQRMLKKHGTLHVNLDASALRPSLHGMTEHPQFGGLTLPDLQKTLGSLGRVPVSSLIVTGLNPTLSGLSVVKTGLRLTVTALLAYIYSRLGLKAGRAH